MNYYNVYTVCGGTLSVFKYKEAAENYFKRCYYSSDGVEKSDYSSVLLELNSKNLGKDHSSPYCNEISINMNQKIDEFYTIKLNDNLSIDKTIKYFEEKIKPILEISEKYDINFKSKMPFKYFGSDSESYVNYSFSNYYKEILEKYGVNISEIYTDEWSDGKYMLALNNEKIELKAWDRLEDVIDNTNEMIEICKNKEGEVEYGDYLNSRKESNFNLNNIFVKDMLDYKLEDDESSTGGLSFSGETLKDFIDDDIDDSLNSSIFWINDRLKLCGIKEITEQDCKKYFDSKAKEDVEL